MTPRDASIIGPQIDRLATAHGHVTPQRLVDAARPADSPLHKYYDWDDRKAAEKWRIEQAKYQLRCVFCVVEIPDSKGRPEATPVRNFFNVEIRGGERTDDNDKPERGYVTIEQVQSSADYLRQVIDDAERQLLGWQDRHSTYMRLPRFRKRFTAVNGAIKRLRKKPR